MWKNQQLHRERPLGLQRIEQTSRRRIAARQKQVYKQDTNNTKNESVRAAAQNSNSKYITFFRVKCSNGFFVKLILGRSFTFCTFECNHGALNLRLQVLALPASVTMARPTKLHNSSTFTDWIC